ncbi:MAG: hypothetical protein IKC08_04055, partial [Lentisphaeria bacterium]|nr:hypothetical protein [Lentisphaeria bacterium]
SGLCSCGTYSAFAPLGLFNIPLMKNFSVKKEYLPELDLFPIQHWGNAENDNTPVENRIAGS